MRITKLSMMLLGTLSFAALLNGCGSSSKEGSVNLDSVATVGDTACVQCHSTAKDALTGDGIIDQYNRSPHASAASLNGAGCEACHGGGAQHNGVGPIPYVTPDAARCATCHTGTNATVFAAALLQASAETNPNTPSNHANGGYEGIAIGEPCYRCHSHEGAVLSNAAGYTGNYGVSAAANADGLLSNNAYKLVQDRDFTKFKGIQCGTCHEHGGALRTVKSRNGAGDVVAWDPNANRKVDQFDLCTSCHNYLDNDGTTLIASGSAAAGNKPKTNFYYHNTSWYRVIASTHWDNPATTGTQSSSTSDVTNTPIEGYVIRKNSANPCFDCHGHEAKANTRLTTPARPTTPHTDWAQSAHAGQILTNKYAAAALSSSGAAEVDAVMTAFTDDNTGIAWTHYNWDNSTKVARGAGDQDRKDCQRCHTSTGAANFMSSPATYDPSKNDFSHLDGWKAFNSRSNNTYALQTSPQNEVLYCWGCHTNAGTGALRNPGAITEKYAAGTTGDPVTIVTYPDVAGSNVCMTCHLGRETGEVIKNDADADGKRNFINSHYLAAGGTLFGTTGYEFTGLDYANPSYFKHDKVGTSAAAGTGTNGPCVGCHMTTPNAHKFTNLTKDNTGTITGITSTACVTCHTGNYALTAAKLQDEEHEYVAALAALNASLAAKGIHFFNAHPYFYQQAAGAGGAFTDWAGVYGFSKWKDTMGAAFNVNLLIHDPGGYAHNRIYAKRLIWDAIDFINDGVISNNDVVTAIDAQVTAGRLSAANATAAKTYLGAARP